MERTVPPSLVSTMRVTTLVLIVAIAGCTTPKENSPTLDPCPFYDIGPDTIMITGRVTDENGALEGARVIAKRSNLTAEATASHSGCYALNVEESGVWEIAVSKEGFQTVGRRTPSLAPPVEHKEDFVLEAT